MDICVYRSSPPKVDAVVQLIWVANILTQMALFPLVIDP